MRQAEMTVKCCFDEKCGFPLLKMAEGRSNRFRRERRLKGAVDIVRRRYGFAHSVPFEHATITEM
jgi:hypothetical protein